MNNYYFKVYNELLSAIKKDSIFEFSKKIKKEDTNNIKNALLKFFYYFRNNNNFTKLKI